MVCLPTMCGKRKRALSSRDFAQCLILNMSFRWRLPIKSFTPVSYTHLTNTVIRPNRLKPGIRKKGTAATNRRQAAVNNLWLAYFADTNISNAAIHASNDTAALKIRVLKNNNTIKSSAKPTAAVIILCFIFDSNGPLLRPSLLICLI